ncbi:MAG: Fe-S cluster assembly protein SufD [Bryobacterales bacterium]|nr:Fe-S cluster assembly protein SufD [Bryobacteraceae bacterium]MDW8130438.1 Fe-S cluster assembly protein SufD [Bryobacterales bacterium]
MSAAVTGTPAGQEAWLAAFAARERRLANECPWWLQGLRRTALSRFAELGFPTTRVEEWKYTNLAPLARTVFEPAGPLAPGDRRPSSWVETIGGAVAWTVNGILGAASAGRDFSIGSLRAAWQETPELVQRHLSRHAVFDRHAFVALNTAFFEDGVLLRIRDGAVLDQPLVLVHYVSGNGDTPLACHGRTLVLAGRNSQASIVEAWVGPDGLVYLTNSVAEAVLGEGAVLEYVRLQLEGDKAYHFSALHARQGRSSSLAVHTVLLGGALTRSEIGSVLAGEGASTVLNGLYLARGDQHMDNYTTLDHAQPHATSVELYKGILDGRSTGVFHGRIIVRPEAQKTDAIQRNRNLLLSPDAVINTKPQLEIYADDVRCTHGATVGQVDADAIFYLRSRGIAHREARRLLTLAFAQEITDRINPASLRERLNAELVVRLDPIEE